MAGGNAAGACEKRGVGVVGGEWRRWSKKAGISEQRRMSQQLVTMNGLNVHGRMSCYHLNPVINAGEARGSAGVAAAAAGVWYVPPPINNCLRTTEPVV